MSEGFIFIFMIFMHVIDDYFIQSAGCLHFLKTKDFWEKEAPEDLYRNDYKIALLMHGISWSFMIMLPLFIHSGFELSLKLSTLFWLNAVIHAFIDNTKANWKSINLWQDQFLHICQMVTTVMVALGGF